MDQTLQAALQNAAATQAALATVTWALGIAFTICFGVVVAGVKVLYTLQSDVSVLIKSQTDQKENHDLQREEISKLTDKIGRLEKDFVDMRAVVRGRNGFSR